MRKEAYPTRSVALRLQGRRRPSLFEPCGCSPWTLQRADSVRGNVYPKGQTRPTIADQTGVAQGRLARSLVVQNLRGSPPIKVTKSTQLFILPVVLRSSTGDHRWCEPTRPTGKLTCERAPSSNVPEVTRRWYEPLQPLRGLHTAARNSRSAFALIQAGRSRGRYCSGRMISSTALAKPSSSSARGGSCSKAIGVGRRRPYSPAGELRGDSGGPSGRPMRGRRTAAAQHVRGRGQ
jgi:hypothetical protein